MTRYTSIAVIGVALVGTVCGSASGQAWQDLGPSPINSGGGYAGRISSRGHPAFVPT